LAKYYCRQVALNASQNVNRVLIGSFVGENEESQVLMRNLNTVGYQSDSEEEANFSEEEDEEEPTYQEESDAESIYNEGKQEMSDEEDFSQVEIDEEEFSQVEIDEEKEEIATLKRKYDEIEKKLQVSEKKRKLDRAALRHKDRLIASLKKELAKYQ
jgi:hypothetical protein